MTDCHAEEVASAREASTRLLCGMRTRPADAGMIQEEVLSYARDKEEVAAIVMYAVRLQWDSSS